MPADHQAQILIQKPTLALMTTPEHHQKGYHFQV